MLPGNLRVEIVEVAPRDGLQNDPALLTTEPEVEFVGRTIGAGRGAEVASFVNPEARPADGRRRSRAGGPAAARSGVITSAWC